MAVAVRQQLARVLLTLAIVLGRFSTVNSSVQLQKGCQQAKPFAECTPKNTTQFSGTCFGGSCHIRDPVDFKFRVSAKYWPRRIDKSIRDLWLRGRSRELGLSWDNPMKMKPTGMSGVWSKDFSYKVDPLCGTLPSCPNRHWSFEFRVFSSEEGGEMLGENIYHVLPVAGSVSGVQVVLPPVVEVSPWFHGTNVAVRSETISVPPQLLGGTGMSKEAVPYEFVLVYPPSFEDNIARRYPLVLVLGKNVTELAAPSIEHAVIREASMREALVIGLPFPEGDACSILPYVTKDIVCKEGLCGEDCQTCRSPERGKPCSKDELQNEMERCGRVRWCGGQANSFIELIEHHILPHLLEVTHNRIDIDPLHSPATIVGYRHGGLFACFAGIKRPDLFGNVACLSPSLYMPYLDEPEYSFRQELQSVSDRITADPSLVVLHYAQTFYIDFGSKDSFHYPMYNARETTAELVDFLVHRLGMTINKNLYFREFPGHSAYVLSDEADLAYFHRLLEPLRVFLAPKGGISWSTLLPLKSLDKEFSTWGSLFEHRMKEVHFGHALLHQHPQVAAAPAPNTLSRAASTNARAKRGLSSLPTIGPQCHEEKHITTTILLASLAVTAFITAVLSILFICLMEQSRGSVKGRSKGGASDSEEGDNSESADDSGSRDGDGCDDGAEELEN